MTPNPTHSTRRRGRLLVPLLIVVALAGATACGEDGDDDEAATASTTSPDAAGDTGESNATADVVAVDYHFDGLPDRIDAGTTLTMRNDSAGEIHELFALKIPDGETRSADELIALPQDELFAALPGEPAVVLLAPPGEEATAVLGDATLAPGRYLVACAVPTGADPDEFMRQAQQSEGPPDVPGGPPHFMAGMYAELVVE
jgi:hypothetical protein